MSIVDLYSKRQKRLRSGTTDIYVYNAIPQPLRVQILGLWDESLGNNKDYLSSYFAQPKGMYEFLVETLRREYGVFALAEYKFGESLNHRTELRRFLLQEKKVEKVIDAIELTFRAIDRLTRGEDYLGRRGADQIATDTIAELNGRFREHGIGYSYENGKVIRVDSQFVHAEVVKESLTLLADPRFHGAEQEFLTAHSHYRKGENKEALNNALKALESTLKIVAGLRAWPFDQDKATAKDLLDLCFANKLIPPFWQGTMGAVRALLENGVPTARHRLSGHGQGATPTAVPEHIVGYVLHMTAAAVVFLVEAHESTQPGSGAAATVRPSPSP